MPTRLLTIPFAAGQDEGVASRVLPAGPLREAINVRQRRSGAFGVRPDYPALSMSEFGGTLVPYDLYGLNGKLLVLGDRQGRARPTDIFSYVQQPGGTWKGTLPPSPATTVGNAVPVVTALRNVGAPQDCSSQINVCRVAAVNGLVCVAYAKQSNVGGNPSFVHIFRASTGETVCVGAMSLDNPHVVVAGNSFWIVGMDSSLDLAGHRFDTTSSTALSGPTTLYTGSVAAAIFSASSVKGAAQFAFIVRDGFLNTVVRRFNEAGAQQTTFAGPAVSADVLTIEADSVTNRVVVAYRVGAADAFAQTYNLATNASVAGPTAMFGQAVTGGLFIQRLTSGSPGMLLVTDDTGGRARSARFSENALGAVTLNDLNNYFCMGRGVSCGGYILIPMISGSVSPTNQLLFIADDSQVVSGVISVAASMDNGIANPGVGTVFAATQGTEICSDLTTGKFYWTRLAEGSDGQFAPFVTELVTNSTERRQSCQVGNALFVSGGVPLHFDGGQVVESGYIERPEFASPLPAGTTGGSLLPGGEYDYVPVWSYRDAQDTETLSQIGNIVTVALSSTQNATALNVYSPHSMRSNATLNSASVIELYRTHCDLQTTTAVVTSDRDFSVRPAAAGDFNGLTLQLAAQTGGTQTVTFGAADNTLAEIVAAINTQTTLMTATAIGGVFQVSSDLAGSGGSITVVGGTTLAIGTGNLGMFVGQTDTGTTLAIKGTVFQRCARVDVNPIGSFGLESSITDTMSDDTLLTQKPLYTQGERGALSGILEHEGPPPCEFCCTVGNRVFIGGLPDRSEVRISKELFQAESIAFSSDSAFCARVEGDVTAVASLDGTPVAFTADAVYVFPASFPDDNGSNGQLGPPQRLPMEEGCDNPNSVCVTSIGIFYQSKTGKLMLLERGAAASIWVGKRMQDTLALFPTVTGVAYVELDNVVCFTCQNAAGTASVILVFDLLIRQWYLDTFSSAQVIKAAVAYQGRLAYIDGSAVRLQSLSLTPAAFIPMTVKTGSIRPFGGKGTGRLPSITDVGEFRGNSRLRLSISYDDGRTFTACKTFDLLTAGGPKDYVVGQTISKQWWPAKVKGGAFVLLFEVLPDGSATPSEGLILNDYTLELEGVQPGRLRLAAADKG